MGRLMTVTRLALADLWAERTLAICNVLALASVLAPLVVLAGLRAGVVEGLRELLLENPHAREIVTASNRSYPAADLAGIAEWSEVTFLAPRTRTLSSSLLVQHGETGPTIRIELLPTAPGDPLVPQPGVGNGDIVVTAAAAAKLQVGAGDTLTGRIGRIRAGQRESAAFPLRVASVAPAESFLREAAFVTLTLAVFIEDFQDGLAEMPPDLQAAPPQHRAEFAGFRLYAAQLEDVPALDGRLRAKGLDVVSHADEVASLTTVDRSLGTLFMTVASLGGSGFLISLGAGLWANVERKRVQLALMRFFGLRAHALRLFPLVQAIVLSAIGALLALAAAQAAAVTINAALAGVLAIHRPLCIISAETAAGAAGLTLVGAILVAGVSSRLAARIEAWEGVSSP